MHVTSHEARALAVQVSTELPDQQMRVLHHGGPKGPFDDIFLGSVLSRSRWVPPSAVARAYGLTHIHEP